MVQYLGLDINSGPDGCHRTWVLATLPLDASLLTDHDRCDRGAFGGMLGTACALSSRLGLPVRGRSHASVSGVHNIVLGLRRNPSEFRCNSRNAQLCLARVAFTLSFQLKTAQPSSCCARVSVNPPNAPHGRRASRRSGQWLSKAESDNCSVRPRSDPRSTHRATCNLDAAC
jgi:hypothetical protein